ncbi:MAG: AAA family ATPase [Candidatus Sumerlaeaceae bacterium]
MERQFATVQSKNPPIRPELARLQNNIELVLKGKSAIVQNAIICILARGHLLIEDVPGVGKTTLAQCIARSISLSFSRIQFTSDMLPSDILGVTMYNQQSREFEFKPGPLFANIVLADELNRTTPKTQSALLEAMNSSQVSTEKQTLDLPQPFMVLATQNPIEFHGTFPLPKSQMDRFLMRIHLGYPALDDEITVLKEQKVVGNLEAVQSVISSEEMLRMQHEVDQVKIDDSLLEYLARIVSATRATQAIILGASTRGALALRRAAQAKAYFEDRTYCVPDDIKSMVTPVLAHRVQIQEGFESTGFIHEEEHRILSQMLAEVDVPL